MALNWQSSILALSLLVTSVNAADQKPRKPKVRAITAFLRVNSAQYAAQVQDVLRMLRETKRAFEQRGYEVETLRITTQPLIELIRGRTEMETLQFLGKLDALAKIESVYVSVGPAMAGASDPPGLTDFLARVLAETEQLNGSVIVAQQDGIHWEAVHSSARVMKYLAEHTPRSTGNFRFAASAMLAPYSPFYPTSYFTGEDHKFSIGLESANVVQRVLANTPNDLQKGEDALKAELGRYLVECEQIAREVEKSSGWQYAGIDPTPAPAGEVSIGEGIEKFLEAKFGSSGTMTVAALITRAVKSIPVKQVGFSGLMLPVMEDSVLAQRWSEGTYGIDALMSFSAVCGTGLDTVPLPGEVTEQQLTRIIGDVATLAYKWNKPLSVRLLPVVGKRAGEKTEFHDPHLVETVLQKVP